MREIHSAIRRRSVKFAENPEIVRFTSRHSSWIIPLKPSSNCSVSTSSESSRPKKTHSPDVCLTRNDVSTGKNVNTTCYDVSNNKTLLRSNPLSMSRAVTLRRCNVNYARTAMSPSFGRRKYRESSRLNTANILPSVRRTRSTLPSDKSFKSNDNTFVLSLMKNCERLRQMSLNMVKNLNNTSGKKDLQNFKNKVNIRKNICGSSPIVGEITDLRRIKSPMGMGRNSDEGCCVTSSASNCSSSNNEETYTKDDHHSEMARHIKECLDQYRTVVDKLLQARRMLLSSSQLPEDDRDVMLKHLDNEIKSGCERLGDRNGSEDSSSSLNDPQPNSGVPSGTPLNPVMPNISTTDVDSSAFLQHVPQLIALLRQNMAKQN